jgi:hypothetical protein
MIGLFFLAIPIWNPNDPNYTAVVITSLALVLAVLGTLLIVALRNPGYLREK